MVITPIRTRIFRERESLTLFILRYIPRIKDGSIIVITSKIVALAEGRTEPLKDDAWRDKVIKRESQWAMRTKSTWLTIKDNTVLSSAGVDRSNADGKMILLPSDSFAAAARLRNELKKRYRVKNFGILITDSRLMPLRAGVVSIAVGYAGFRGIRDYRGTKDIFGRRLKMTRTDVADSLATAAVVTMGEGAEQRPLALIHNAPVEFLERVNRKELVMDFRDDIYLPLFQQAKKVRIKRIKGPW